MTNERIKKAADTMAKATAKLAKTDPEMAERMVQAMAREMDAIRAGR